MNLEQLLKDAIRQAKATPLASRPPKAETPHQRYLNPSSWTDGKIIELIYDDGESLQSLGLFRESHYRFRPGGRRLSRLPAGGQPDRFEFCYGEHWVSARGIWQPPVDSPADAELIRQRFLEMLDEYD